MFRGIVLKSHYKTFGKSFQCLGKVGTALSIEINDERVSLRTLNAAESAYASIY